MRLPTVPLSRTPETFTLETVIRIEDRVAAALFAYRALLTAARRRVLHLLAWVLIGLLTVIGYQTWQATEGEGLAAFAARLLSNLTGISGLPIPVVTVPLLVYFFAMPALARRRLRRWFKDEGLGSPTHGQYRFAAGGLVTTEGGGSSAIACRRVTGIAETPDHLFIRLKGIEDVIALPRRQIEAEQLDGLRLWAAACHVDGPDSDLLFIESEDDQQEPSRTMWPLRARFLPAEADRIALLDWQQERPGMRRQRRSALVNALIITALLPLAILILLWLLDPERVPFRYAAPLAVDIAATELWKWILGLWALVAIIAMTHSRMRRAHARQLGRALNADVPRYETEIRLSDAHVETLEDGLRTRWDWSAFDRVERLSDHLLLRRRAGDPLMLPLRVLGEGERERFERMALDRIANGRPLEGTL